jgi:hypothetical protein
MQCNSGLSLPSHDTLAVLTAQSTFYGRTMAKINGSDWVTDNDSVMSDDGESGD